MTQNELNFIQEALYAKCDTLLDNIVKNANAAMKKETKKTEKKEEK